MSQTQGVPDSPLGNGARFGDFCVATADFREQYYGLAPFVVEDSPAHSGQSFPALITTGLIDPGTCAWGQIPTKFNKVNWTAPRVDLRNLARQNEKLASWAHRRLVPKILMATQGRVLEAVVDSNGEWLPSVPVVTIEPNDLRQVWRLAAALMAPCVSAYAASHYMGAGLTLSAIKLSAKQVAQLPVPSDLARLEPAARALRAAQATQDRAARRALLLEMGSLANEAYGAGMDTYEWWAARLPSGKEK